MLEDFKKTINSILYERMSSPLFASFVLSWSIWNWDVLYFLVADREYYSVFFKIAYAQYKLKDINHSVLGPLISSIIIVTFYPIVSNGAYWFSLKFDNWKYNQKMKIEGQQLLPVGKSIELRLQLKRQQEEFNNLLQEKNDEISEKNEAVNQSIRERKELVDRITNLTNEIQQLKIPPKSTVKNTQNYSPLYLSLRNNKNFPNLLENLYSAFKKEYKASKYYVENLEIKDSEAISYLMLNDIIAINAPNKEEYILTSTGINLIREYINDKYSS